MRKNLDRYLDEICRDDLFRRARIEAVEEWGEDIPMTILFSYFGKIIAREFAQMPADQKARIFEAIEVGMVVGDESLKAVLCAGLLEGLYGQIYKDEAVVEAVMNHLKDSSKDHLLKWISWQE